jgi:hypothetical protein
MDKGALLNSVFASLGYIFLRFVISSSNGGIGLEFGPCPRWTGRSHHASNGSKQMSALHCVGFGFGFEKGCALAEAGSWIWIWTGHHCGKIHWNLLLCVVASEIAHLAPPFQDA